MKQHQRIPPEVPTELGPLDRAIMLLGSRTKGELRAKHQQELARLLGRYPDTETAAVWKKALKELRKDEFYLAQRQDAEEASGDA